jgi:hypothetical protein
MLFSFRERRDHSEAGPAVQTDDSSGGARPDDFE